MAIISSADVLIDRLISHVGPVSYQKNAATYDPALASEAGCKYLYRVDGCVDSTGLYQVDSVNPTAGPLGGGAASIALRWFVIATGLEVADGFNLSGSTVNLRVLGV